MTLHFARTFVAALLAAGYATFPARAQVPMITEVTPAPAVKPVVKPAVPHRRRPRTVASPEAVAPPVLIWKTLIRTCDNAPALAGSGVYVAAGGQLQQVDAGGRTLFASDIGATRGRPSVDETRIYIGTDRGTVYGLDRSTGRPLWKWAGTATDTILNAPSFGAGRVYVESSDNNVYSLAAATGGRIWTFTRPDGSLGYSGPIFLRGDDPLLGALNGPDVLFICGDTTLYRLDPASGKESWHSFIGGKSLSTVAVGGGKVFVGGDGTGLSAFAAADGKPLWSFAGKPVADKAVKDWFGPPVFAAGAVYVATYDRFVYAVDAGTGKQKWFAHLPGSGCVVPPVLDPAGKIVYAACDGDGATLVALDAHTGAKLWQIRPPGGNGMPVISEKGDRLYLAGTDGYLFCYGLR